MYKFIAFFIFLYITSIQGQEHFYECIDGDIWMPTTATFILTTNEEYEFGAIEMVVKFNATVNFKGELFKRNGKLSFAGISHYKGEPFNFSGRFSEYNGEITELLLFGGKYLPGVIFECSKQHHY